MTQQNTKRSKKAGLPPGTLIHLGDRKSENAKITEICYDSDDFTETVHPDIVSAINSRDHRKITWLNIDGLHNTDIIAAAGAEYNLHPLLLEDILNTQHRPKVEEFDKYLFVSLKMISVNSEKKEIEAEQLSLILGENWLITFQEQEGDVFNDIRVRLRDSKGLIRHKGADYLLYRLIDTVVDHYFYVIEHIVDVSEELEKEVLESFDQDILPRIQKLKKEQMNMKKALFPLREVVSSLQNEDNVLIDKATLRYLRDVYEHIIQLSEALDSSRESSANIMDLYLSGVNNKMNEVMKVLTMISTIFIPLSFVVGLYGMNFDNIPELHYWNAYYYVWGFFVLVVAGMMYYFKRKKWL